MLVCIQRQKRRSFLLPRCYVVEVEKLFTLSHANRASRKSLLEKKENKREIELSVESYFGLKVNGQRYESERLCPLTATMKLATLTLG